MMWYDKFIDDIKELIDKKKELEAKRKEIINSIRAGKDYFSARVNRRDSDIAKQLANGSTRMIQLTSELIEVQNAIDDIDIVIVTNLEAYMSNFIGKFDMPTRMSDAGDVIKDSNIYAVPYVLDENKKEVTPDDVWFLKIIKQAYKATNISLIEK